MIKLKHLLEQSEIAAAAASEFPKKAKKAGSIASKFPRLANNALHKDLIFKIPTGYWKVRNDDGGKGHYGANRGSRKHHGVDLKTTLNQQMVAPIDGIVKRRKASSTSKLDGTMIQGTGKYKGYNVYMFYTRPNAEGSKVKQGDVVSKQLALQRSNKGDYSEDVTDHTHIKITFNGKTINPTIGSGNINWIV